MTVSWHVVSFFRSFRFFGMLDRSRRWRWWQEAGDWWLFPIRPLVPVPEKDLGCVQTGLLRMIGKIGLTFNGLIEWHWSATKNTCQTSDLFMTIVRVLKLYRYSRNTHSSKTWKVSSTLFLALDHLEEYFEAVVSCLQNWDVGAKLWNQPKTQFTEWKRLCFCVISIPMPTPLPIPISISIPNFQFPSIPASVFYASRQVHWSFKLFSFQFCSPVFETMKRTWLQLIKETEMGQGTHKRRCSHSHLEHSSAHFPRPTSHLIFPFLYYQLQKNIGGNEKLV